MIAAPGWSGGRAAAWAGMTLGALGAAAAAIETGPGAVSTALGGGIAVRYGFAWIADPIGKH